MLYLVYRLHFCGASKKVRSSIYLLPSNIPDKLDVDMPSCQLQLSLAEVGDTAEKTRAIRHRLHEMKSQENVRAFRDEVSVNPWYVLGRVGVGSNQFL